MWFIPKFISFQPPDWTIMSYSPYNITFPFWTKNERKKPKAFDFLVNYIFLLLLVCLYSLFLCFKFSYSKCVEFEIDKNIQHWNVDCTEVFFLLTHIRQIEFFLTFPVCFWIPIIFSNMNSSCSNSRAKPEIYCYDRVD